jgi:hypothetical protein
MVLLNLECYFYNISIVPRHTPCQYGTVSPAVTRYRNFKISRCREYNGDSLASSDEELVRHGVELAGHTKSYTRTIADVSSPILIPR